jgi:hypothetical protein
MKAYNSAVLEVNSTTLDESIQRLGSYLPRIVAAELRRGKIVTVILQFRPGDADMDGELVITVQTQEDTNATV